MRISLTTLAAALPLSAILLVTGCKTGPEAPKQAAITQEVSAEASVVAVDAITRAITLQSEDGAQFVIIAGPEVVNFNQIKAGSTVTARYVETLSVRLLEPDEAAVEPTVGIVAGAAEEGEMPGVAIASGVVMTVTVESVDKAEHLVVFTGPSGDIHAIRAQREEGKAFVAGLKKGDKVEISYGEALGLGVE